MKEQSCFILLTGVWMYFLKRCLTRCACLLFLFAANTTTAAPFAYLNAGESVAVVDLNTMSEVKRLDVGRTLGHLDARPGGKYVYGVIAGAVGSSLVDREITVIDTTSHTVAAHIAIPPEEGFSANDYLTVVTSSPDGQRIYAVDSAGHLYFIDAQSRQVLASVHVGGGVKAIDVLPDNSVVMVALSMRGTYRFYDTENFTYKGVGGFGFFSPSGQRSIRANPNPRNAFGGPYRHLYHSCGFDRRTDTDECVVSSVGVKDGEYGYVGAERMYTLLPGGNTSRGQITFSYDGQLAFVNGVTGDFFPDGYRKSANIRVVQANGPRYIGSIKFDTNDSIPLNIEAHPLKNQLYVYTGRADLYKVSYVWGAEGFPSTQEKIHISGGGIAEGHFIGGPLPLNARTAPGSVTSPNLPINAVSEYLFQFHNGNNELPVGLECKLDKGAEFSLDTSSQTVEPGGWGDVTLSFSTAEVGNYTDTLTCTDSTGSIFSYSVSGNYVVPTTATPDSGSSIILPTQIIADGATSRTINFQNSNSIEAVLACSVTSGAGPFSLSSGNIVIPGKGSADLTVFLNPETSGIFTGTLSCGENLGGSFTYNLSGESFGPLEAKLVDAWPIRGIVDMGYLFPENPDSHLKRRIQFSNTNASPTGLSCEVRSTASDFYLSEIPGSIAPNGTFDLTVTYHTDRHSPPVDASLECEDSTGHAFIYKFRAGAVMPVASVPATGSEVVFPRQQVGTPATSAPFIINSTGNRVDLDVYCAPHLLSEPFSDAAGPQPHEKFVAGEDASLSFDVFFDSTSAGEFSSEMICWVMENNIGDGLVEELAFTLKGSAFYTLTSSPPSGSTIELPQFTVDPTPAEEKTTDLLVKASNSTISFQNHASADETLSCSINDGSAFAIDQSPLTIPANSNATLTITVSAKEPGDYTDILTCSGSSGDLFTFTLKAKGVEAPPRRTEMQLPLSEGPHSGKILNLSVTDSEWNLDAAQSLTAASVGTALPQGVILPHGAVSLRLTDGTAGNSSTIVLTYPFDLPAGARYYKYGPTADNPADHWYAYPGAVISGNTITLTLTDGGAGDSDLSVNGIIDDPGGPAWISAPGNVTAIPTLPQWAMMLLAGIMGMLALSKVQRVRST